MKKTILFIIITFAVTWLMWLPTVLNNYMDVPDIFLLMGMFASFTPTVVGIMFLKKNKQWYKGRFKIKVSKSVMLMVLFYIPIIGLISYGLTHLIDTNFKGEIASPLMSLVMFLQILFIGGPLGEEIGWRGFLQPALTKSNVWKGTLILGLIWSLWHLPLFYMTGTVQSQIPMYQFILQNTLFTFYYTWIYLKTEGNLLWIILFHTVANTTSAVIPYWQSNTGRWIGFGLLLIGFIVLPKRGVKHVHRVE